MRLIFFITIAVLLTSCKGCITSFAEQKASVKKICPTCTFVYSQSNYYAVDTAKQPNIIYIVDFKSGGRYYTASDVDHMVRVN